MLTIKELVDQIDKYDNSYYNEFKSLVSDQEYDGLKDQLRSRAPELLTKENKKKDDLVLESRVKDALERIGAPPPEDGWPKESHEVSMGSLNKVNTIEEFKIWYKKCTC